jgi:hypothetical protein
MSNPVAIAVANFEIALRRLEEAVAAGIEDPEPKYTAMLIALGNAYLQQMKDDANAYDAQDRAAHGAAASEGSNA